jgi:hypothetical protein
MPRTDEEWFKNKQNTKQNSKKKENKYDKKYNLRLISYKK